ncbi:MAG: multicopper oxidase domain-containing protein [Rhodospirillales bacterium]|nr:multicopper oxidase domain-containing protein [Rhodospirillales bacterium]
MEAHKGRPVVVKWINDLVDAQGRFLPHLLPVDPTLHWANPPGGTQHRDTRPDFTGQPTPGRYTGPVPIVTHVHGMRGVGDESDGYPEAWFLPNAIDIPAEYAAEGTWYNFFRSKAQAKGVTWSKGSATFIYPNQQRASTVWYHDHALGMTRLNVYAGPAGFYLIRGGPDDIVYDRGFGRRAVLPGPAPQRGDPPGLAYSEIPIAIQDRSFNRDGSLFYPDSRKFFDGIVKHYIPDGPFPPIWNPEFFGDVIVVNGRTWPYLNVEPRRYRLRLLNGCQSRFLILRFDNSRVKIWKIGNEGGFLKQQVNVSNLTMSPAERADLIVDFSEVIGETVRLLNTGPDAPFGGPIGGPVPANIKADPMTTGQVMQFRVSAQPVADPTTPPVRLVLPTIRPLPRPVRTRQLALLESVAPGFTETDSGEAPVEALLGTVEPGTLRPMELMWGDPVTENPKPGDTEIWEFYNFTGDAHPMHVHEVLFQVINREGLIIEEDDSGMPTGAKLAGKPRPPERTELGFKDTVIALPGEVTRIVAKFDNSGQFVWHCHIVEHEDNEMMRPYRIGPVQPGQPMPNHMATVASPTVAARRLAIRRPNRR